MALRGCDWRGVRRFRLDSLGLPAAWEAEEDEGAGDEEGEVAEGCREAELAADETAEATAFERLAVQDVDVVEGVGGEAEEEQGRERCAEACGARPEEQDGRDEFGGDHGKGHGPDQTGRDEVGEVGGEVGEGVELRARREEEERREAEAAEMDEPVEERTLNHQGHCLVLKVSVGLEGL